MFKECSIQQVLLQHISSYSLHLSRQGRFVIFLFLPLTNTISHKVKTGCVTALLFQNQHHLCIRYALLTGT